VSLLVQELPGPDAKGAGEPEDELQRRAAGPALDLREADAVQARAPGEGLLRQPPPPPPALDVPTDVVHEVDSRPLGYELSSARIRVADEQPTGRAPAKEQVRLDLVYVVNP